jgi:hypothetical protein
LTASSNGKVAVGVCSGVGRVILFMSILQVRASGFYPFRAFAKGTVLLSHIPLAKRITAIHNTLLH